MNIGMIGNFSVPYSTESDRKWSFEKLGHKVIIFQENKTTASQIRSFFPLLDMLVYSHTHGWAIPNLIELFKEAKTKGIPTVSVHLDRWAWLKRVEDIGKEATWFTEYIFMADGSPEAVELYERHGLNWHYLPPGVVERDCKIVNVPLVNGLKMYIDYEIVFTGSINYHPEYSFRPQIIDFLHKTYGDKFAHFGNDGKAVVRGLQLNELYGRAKIVVGDSCFGGRPRYTSDRYQEVRGRGGFLLHPHVEGVETNGVANYKAGNLQDLKTQIDYWLDRNDERENMRIIGHEWVKQNETYTQRAEQLIKEVGL